MAYNGKTCTWIHFGLCTLVLLLACHFWHSTISASQAGQKTLLERTSLDQRASPQNLKDREIAGTDSYSNKRAFAAGLELHEGNFTEKVSRPTWPKGKYRIYLSKGCQLYDMMHEKSTGPSTQYVLYDSLEHWGWTQNEDSSPQRIDQLLSSIEVPLQAQGVSIAAGLNRNIEWTHSLEKKYDQTYPVSRIPIKVLETGFADA